MGKPKELLQSKGIFAEMAMHGERRRSWLRLSNCEFGDGELGVWRKQKINFLNECQDTGWRRYFLGLMLSHRYKLFKPGFLVLPTAPNHPRLPSPRACGCLTKSLFSI